MHPAPVQREATYNGFTDILDCLAAHCPDNRIERFAFDQRHQGAQMALAYHRVTLPIYRGASRYCLPDDYSRGRLHCIGSEKVGIGRSFSLDGCYQLSD